MALGQAFVQIADNTPGSGTTTTFTNPETAADFNVVIVSWDGTTSVTSVTDSNGNTYVLAGTSSSTGLAEAVYYARNISVATTTTPTVSVNFVKALSDADVRVAEYTGFSSAAVTVDNWIGNAGGNSPATSNNMTTSTSSLIVGAGSAINTFQSGGIPTGLTSRGINVFGDVTMDSNTAVPAGTYAAGANVSGAWVMQAAGFSIAGITTVTPTVTAIAPNTGGVAGGDSVTITGTNFAPGATALFGTAPGGLALLNCVVTASTTMTCNTPPDNEGIKDLTVVNVDGKNGSLIGAFTYSINPPVITGISPATTTTNGTTTITITGSSFEPGAQVNVGGQLPQTGTGVFGDNPTVLSSTSMTFTTPALPIGAADVEVRNPDGGNTIDSAALTYTLGTGPINYIQRSDAATGSSAQTVPASPMANPQGKGNLNVVIIGWTNGAVVSSVTDTENNTYQPALPVIPGTSLNQVIYYAKNIVGDNASCSPNCNTVTVNFSGGASSPDVRVLEYSGLDPNNPLDQVAGNAGSGPTADTGVCSNTSASELIVAGATVSSEVTAAGSGFTTVDYTFNGNNAEQQITTAISSCEATAVLVSGNWVIQSVSFKAGSAAPSFTLTADAPTSQTVTAGSNASYALTLAAVNGFSSPVTLTCSGLPTGASCGFSPASPVTPGSSTADALTISTIGTTPAGTSTVTVTGTAGAVIKTATVTLTVMANTTPGFTLTATPTSATIATPGGSATSVISVNATNGFSAAVGLACAVTGTGTPAPTCSLSSSSITGSATSTLTVNTTANSAANSPRATGLFYALLLPIGGITLLGAGFSSRRKMLVGMLLVCMMIAGFIFMTACGGSSSTKTPPGGGTPAGTYTVTVTGTSGSLSSPATFTVTVQ
jgi:hypothetical protein